jgi:hypothetical protein
MRTSRTLAERTRNTEAKTPPPHPTAGLVDRDGREALQLIEKDYKRRPTDDEIRAGASRLRSGN